MTAEDFAALVIEHALLCCPPGRGAALAAAAKKRILGAGRSRDGADGALGWAQRKTGELLDEAAAEPADCAAWAVAAALRSAQTSGRTVPILVLAEVVQLSAELLAAVLRLGEELERPSG